MAFCLQVRYDAVVVACGEKSATFGTPGVEEHCCFLKEIADAVTLRNRIGQCFELASMPGLSPERIEALLRFVVVGGGPTGVEFAGTLCDFLKNDLAERYPALIGIVTVVLLQSGNSILTAFSAGLQARVATTITATTSATDSAVVEPWHSYTLACSEMEGACLNHPFVSREGLQLRSGAVIADAVAVARLRLCYVSSSSQGIAEQSLSAEGVVVRKNVRVTKVEAGAVTIRPSKGGPDEARRPHTLSSAFAFAPRIRTCTPLCQSSAFLRTF